MTDLDELYAFQVAGIDYSTHALDIVLLDYDDTGASWTHVDLVGPNGGGFQAALRIRDRIISRVDWSNVQLLYLERPFSHNRDTLWQLGLVAGAILASLPAKLRRGAVNEIATATWRTRFGVHQGGRTNDIKKRVRVRALQLGFDPGPDTPLDAYEAFGIAWAAREENRVAATIGRA